MFDKLGRLQSDIWEEKHQCTNVPTFKMLHHSTSSLVFLNQYKQLETTYFYRLDEFSWNIVPILRDQGIEIEVIGKINKKLPHIFAIICSPVSVWSGCKTCSSIRIQYNNENSIVPVKN